MKKVIVASLASLAFASTAFAAVPGMDIAAGQTQLGYSYNNLKTTQNAGIGNYDLGTFHANSFQAAYGLSDKIALAGDYLNSESRSYFSPGLDNVKFNNSEFGLQYKLNSNFALSAGNVKSEIQYNGGTGSTSEMFGGIAYKAAITNNVGGYASYIRSSNVQDWKAGLTYGLGKNTSVDLGYRHYENSGLGTKAEGMGFGVNHKF